MRRPSPWIVVPVALATLAGGVLGALITRVSCAPDDCVVASIGIGVLSAAGAFFGVGVVVVLAVRSIAEWQRISDRQDPAPPRREQGPPTC